ncbi:MAG: hypothetical protein LBF85_00420 [Tannerella sp.]|jgi:hypothetical protein|nr:hypothetical protein [Tannerella sp.]
MTKDIYIGIDPDTEKSGVAFLETGSRRLELSVLPFPELIDSLTFFQSRAERRGLRYVTLVEAGWMVVKSNYHIASGRRGERVAKNVGANHETGKKIIEMCRHKGLPVIAVHPLKKIWRGAGGKITHEELSAITGYAGKTNQEMRDAALIAWIHAGFPLTSTVAGSFQNGNLKSI